MGTQPSLKPRVVGIGELALSDDPDERLVTYSLGSCIGVAVWDSELRLGGLIHCLLPSSKQGQDQEAHNPARFVDTGMVELLRLMFERGAQRKKLLIKVAGGASPLQNCETFRIGQRNYATLKKVLWRNDLLIADERVGGTSPRTLTLQVADGRTFVRTGQSEEEI